MTPEGVLLVQCHFATTPEAVGEQLPLADASGRVWLVKRGHLTNAESVRRELSRRVPAGSPLRTDAELMLASYLVWDGDLGGRLEGHFTFAVWDGRIQRLRIVRDHLGLRPCFVHDGPTGFIAASEPWQILPFPGVSDEPDDVTLADLIGSQNAVRRRTLYTDIKRPLPATITTAGQSGTRTALYYEPPWPGLPTRGRPIDHAPAVFEAFEHAVAAAMRSHKTVVCELSGGLDSSSVLGMAAYLGERSAEGIASLHALSYLYPGLECDESEYIDAVRRKWPVPWTAFDDRPLSLRSGAAGAKGVPLAPSEELDGLFGSLGARVLLSGHGGDEIFFGGPMPIAPDLRPKGSELEYLWWSSGRSVRTLASRVRRELVRPRAPACVVDGYLRAKGTPQYTTVLSERGLSLLRQAAAEEDIEDPRKAAARDLRWNRPMNTSYEASDAKDLRRGVETRYPMLDMRLVDVAGSLPIALHAWRGMWRAVQKTAFRPVLPIEVLGRVGKAEFTLPRLMSAVEHPSSLDAVVARGLVKAVLPDPSTDSLEPGTVATRYLTEWSLASEVSRWLMRD